MKQIKAPLYVFMSLIIGFSSCKKEDSDSTAATDPSTSSTIAVAASASTAVSDTVYLLQPCPSGYRRDSASQASLPATVAAYLDANYSGYVFHRAFSVDNRAGDTAGYVVVIYYNDKPVGLIFDTTGNFVRVLEQREKGDLGGKGWHLGGRFEERGGLHKDTIALNALPTVIKTYMTVSYPSDTLLKAYRNRDSSFVVVSKNNGAFATLFRSSGAFVKRVQLSRTNNKPGVWQSVDQSALPATALTFLGNAFPNFAFENAYSLTVNGSVKGYLVLFNANNTKYAAEFGASGNFLGAATIY